jgi:predicted site-specific integrase-resolvase
VATLETAEWLNATEVSALFVQAGLFRVPRSTLRRWTLAGRITSVRAAGGPRRYKGSEARALIAETLNSAARNTAETVEAVA